MNHALFRRWNPWLALIVRLYMGGLFVAASWHKILHPASFALDIATYQILPLYLVNAMAIVLPWVELAAGLMLMAGIRNRAAALLVTGMIALFTVALVIAVSKGLDMSCGCFASQGMEDDPISWITVLRDLGWLALCLYILFLDRAPLGVDRFRALKGAAE